MQVRSSSGIPAISETYGKASPLTNRLIILTRAGCAIPWHSLLANCSSRSNKGDFERAIMLLFGCC